MPFEDYDVKFTSTPIKKKTNKARKRLVFVESDDDDEIPSAQPVKKKKEASANVQQEGRLGEQQDMELESTAE